MENQLNAFQRFLILLEIKVLMCAGNKVFVFLILSYAFNNENKTHSIPVDISLKVHYTTSLNSKIDS